LEEYHNSRIIPLTNSTTNTTNTTVRDSSHHRQKSPPPPPPPRVLVFSESESFESLTVFSTLGYEVITDKTHPNSTTADVWTTITNANVVILSKSSFSLIPAVLNHRHHPPPPPPNNNPATIWYTQFWHRPLPHWRTVEQKIRRRSKRELEKFQKRHCSGKNVTSWPH
jgi:hypothetical protein